MKKRMSLVLICALLLTLAACDVRGTEEAPYHLWYLADHPALSGQVTAEEGVHGSALAGQPYRGELEPEALLTALLAGPEEEGLRSPFPRGVTVRGVTWDQTDPGRLKVNLSEQYGALADISLTLADYCIVLTLSQAEGVETVEITSAGHSVSYRNHQLLSADDAVLWDELVEQPAS